MARNRWAEQAALEALLRFGPEVSALNELQRAALGNFTRSVKTARGTANAIGRAVRAERPEVKQAYEQAGQDATAAYAIADPALASLGPGAASLTAAAALEREGFQRRLGESEAAALTDLSQRRIGAQQGRAAAVQQARSTLVDDLTKVLRGKRDLARQRGAFTQLTTRELRQSALERAAQMRMFRLDLSQQERQSLRGSGIDPDTGKPIPGGPLDPDANNRPGDQTPKGGGGRGGNRATRAQIAAAQDIVDLALSEARTMKQARDNAGQPFRRSDIAELLKAGSKEEQLHDPKTGKPLFNKDGTPKKVPGVPQIKSQLLLSAALDQAYRGYVTEGVARRLRKRGIHVRDLGLTPYRVWREQLMDSGAAQTGGT